MLTRIFAVLLLAALSLSAQGGLRYDQLQEILRSSINQGLNDREIPRLLQAANTLVRTDTGGWRAENTDVMGVGTALTVSGVERVEHAAILGAGGTAAAAATALAPLGARQSDVVAREPARAGHPVGPVARGSPALARRAPLRDPARVGAAPAAPRRSGRSRSVVARSALEGHARPRPAAADAADG